MTIRIGTKFATHGTTVRNRIVDRIVKQFGKTWIESVEVGQRRDLGGYRRDESRHFFQFVREGTITLESA